MSERLTTDNTAETAWERISRDLPESFWDAAFWPHNGNGWESGSLDVADRKRIGLALLASPALADLLATERQQGREEVAARVEGCVVHNSLGQECSLIRLADLRAALADVPAAADRERGASA